MTADDTQPVFLDTTVISNFASTDSVEFLATVVESPTVVPAVRVEIEQGYAQGHTYLECAINSFDQALPIQETTSPTRMEMLRDRVDAGEAESIVAALEHNGSVATDDLAARSIAKEMDISVTGSIGLLVRGVDKDIISKKTANQWIAIWRRDRGYYAPVKNINDLV